MRRGPPLAALCAFAGALSAGASAQEAGHQRLSVESEARNRVEAALGLSWRPEASDLSAELEASLEYTWKRSLSLSLALPLCGAYDGDAQTERWRTRWGDPSVALSCLWRGESLRAQASIGYAYPLEREDARGFHAFSPSLSLSTVRDPVVLSLGLDLRLCLPRAEGGYLLWPPLSASLSLSAWELLNDRVSYRLSFSPGLSFGTERLGLGGRSEPSWSLGLGVSVSWDERAWGLQSGWGGSLGSGGGGALSLRGSCRKEW